MAYWVYKTDKAQVILTPKVASRSIVKSIEGQAKAYKFEKGRPFAICLRHPLDRLGAVRAHKETWSIVKRSTCKPRFGRPTITDHMAPQVDYINFRIAGGRGTHKCIPFGAEDLIQQPDFVFFYEDMPDSYYGLMDFLGVKVGEVPHENSHKRGRDYKEVWGNDLDKIVDRYEKDLAFYSRLREGKC